MPKDKCMSLQESEGCQERRSPQESDNGWVDEDHCPWGSLPMRIAAHEDHCPWGSLPMIITAHEDHCPWRSLPMRIAVCEDCWGDNTRCGKCTCRCARGHRACVRPCTFSHLESCERKTVGPCVFYGLCACGYGTWMLQDDRSAFILQQKSLLHENCRVKPRGQESENIPNKNKTKSKFLFTVFNL